MHSVGLRDLQQSASELLRRVEAGESIEVTVAGRSRAMLVPAQSRRWRTWADVASALDGPADPSWDTDRALIDPP